MKSVYLDTSDKANDCILTGCLVQLHHVSSKTAYRWIEEFVQDITESLQDNGIYEVGSIGNLTQEEDGQIGFAPCEAGVDTPDYYGLDAFRISPLPTTAHAPLGKPDATHITISMRRSTIRRVAAVAAVVVLAMILFIPGYNRLTTGGTDIAHIFSTESIRNIFSFAEPNKEVYTEAAPKVYPKAKTITKVVGNQVITQDVKSEKEAEPVITSETSTTGSKTKKAETKKPSETLKPETSPKQQSLGYVIVLASAVPEKNANEYVDKLKASGINGVSTVQDGRMLRVVRSGFKTEDDAVKAMRQMRESSSEFSDIWIKKI